ncbi:MAG TPA: hypothetical protein VNW06_03655 [Cytophagaceae bacterium]|jgi:hypothetical protein|nr:hypothetical protein [Cytophagaceae bacterium]
MSLPPDDKSLAAKEGTFVKALAAIQKLIAKEFLWILFAILLSIPLAFIINYGIELYVNDVLKNIIKEETGCSGTFLGSYLISFAGIYFSRMVEAAIKTQLKAVQAK